MGNDGRTDVVRPHGHSHLKCRQQNQNCKFSKTQLRPADRQGLDA